MMKRGTNNNNNKKKKKMVKNDCRMCRPTCWQSSTIEQRRKSYNNIRIISFFLISFFVKSTTSLSLSKRRMVVGSPWWFVGSKQQTKRSSSLLLLSSHDNNSNDELQNHEKNKKNHNVPSNHKNKNNAIYYFLESHSPPDNEKRPTRIISKKKKNKYSSSFNHDKKEETKKLNGKELKFQDWGVQLVSSSNNHQQQDDDDCKFPESLYSLARKASHAIRGTLYQQNKLDPNIVSNAMRTSRFDYRPLAFASANPPGRDIGRLGIELDGLRYLLFPKMKHTDDVLQSFQLENKAMIRLSLYMAGMLSHHPWIEEEDNDDTSNSSSSGRPIAMYFNSLGQALMASQELRLLKKVQQQTNNQISMFDTIRILCLGQDDIPKDMIPDYNDKKGRRKWGTSSDIRDGKVRPENGLMMIVQQMQHSKLLIHMLKKTIE